jgi:hypothetical protein
MQSSPLDLFAVDPPLLGFGPTPSPVDAPRGDPGALRDAAARFRAAAGAVGGFGGALDSLPRECGDFEGQGRQALGERCITASEAGGHIAAALNATANAIDDNAAAVERVQHDIQVANAANEEAAHRGAHATARGSRAQQLINVSALTGDPAEAAHADLADAHAEATRAADNARAARQRGLDALTAFETEMQPIAARYAAIAQAFPGGQAGASTPAGSGEGGGDREHGLGGFIVGVGKGLWHGAEGLYDGGAMVVKSSTAMRWISRDTFERQWDENAAAAKAAWDHPGEFGKAVVNWDDLSNGRVGEWIGGLGPDVAAAVATGGGSAAATRGAAVAHRAEEFSSAGRALERTAATHDGLGPTFGTKTSAGTAFGDPTLSGWKQPRPDGYQSVSTEDVRQYSSKIGHDLGASGFRDQTSQTDGFPGKFNASHAEKQAAIANPGQPLAVSEPMCKDCQAFFAKEAQFTGLPRTVRDPQTLWVFMPDGTALQNPLAGATVNVPLISPWAAASGGVSAQGLQTAPAWTGSHP